MTNDKVYFKLDGCLQKPAKVIIVNLRLALRLGLPE